MKPRAAVIAYTEYPWDGRVRGESEMLVHEGYTVHVICLTPRVGPSPSHLGGVHLHELPLTARRGGRLRYVYQYMMFLGLSSSLLVRLHIRHPFSLVHVHTLPDFAVFAAAPMRLAGVPVLLDLHEVTPEIIAARFHLSVRDFLPRLAAFVEQVSCRFASHVIVANDGYRAAVVARGVKEGHITAVYNVATQALSVDLQNAVRQRFRIPGGRLLVHAGGLNRERDVHTLVQAISEVPEDVQLVVAGEGEEEYVALLKGLTHALGLDQRVHFLGKVPRDEAYALMSLSEVGVVTLEDNPLTQVAWPTRATEYLALGKTMVVPRLPFIARTLGRTVSYYIPGDPKSLAIALNHALGATEHLRGPSGETTSGNPHVRFASHAKLTEVYARLEEAHVD